MLVIVGSIIVLGAVLGGFTMSGGHIGALIHPSEILTIGGAALGALITMCPQKVLKDLLHGLIQSVKGSPYTKRAYLDLFKAMYELLKTARYNGLLALEAEVNNPQNSAVFSKYPSLVRNDRLMKFICGSLSMIVDNSVTPDQVPELLEAEIHSLENEHHGPQNVLTKTADALPGFGIVAAVLGIVITMGAIDGPIEEIGHKVGAALVGTFLGILLSYGFLSPLSVKLEFLAEAEVAYYRTVATFVEGFAHSRSPSLVMEHARRSASSEVRPSPEELEAALRELG